MRLPRSNDSRLLLAGLAAFFALVIYLSVAFANTHGVSAVVAPSAASKFAPWVPKYHSTLALVPRRRGGGIAVRVRRGWIGSYGAVVPTLAAAPPPGSRVVVGLWLRGPAHGPIQVLVDEFPAGPHPNIIDTTVPATARWRYHTFRARIKGRWLGLGMFVGRSTDGKVNRWFAVRGLNVIIR